MTLKLLMRDEYGKDGTAKGWLFDKEKGFVIVDYGKEEGINLFPVELGAEELAPIIFKWLQGEEAESMELDGWDRNADHDGHNEKGFRVYCEDWGHVNGRWGCYAAVTPAYCWYGK